MLITLSLLSRHFSSQSRFSPGSVTRSLGILIYFSNNCLEHHHWWWLLVTLSTVPHVYAQKSLLLNKSQQFKRKPGCEKSSRHKLWKSLKSEVGEEGHVRQVVLVPWQNKQNQQNFSCTLDKNYLYQWSGSRRSLSFSGFSSCGW